MQTGYETAGSPGFGGGNVGVKLSNTLEVLLGGKRLGDYP